MRSAPTRLMLSLALLAWPAAAGAYPNDIDFSGLAKWQNGCDPFGKEDDCQLERNGTAAVPDQRAFDGLMEELAAVMAPRWAGPAKTSGQAGFNVVAEITAHRINNHHSYWGRALERSARKKDRDVVLPVMGTMQGWVGKGLPYGIEVAAGGTYLMESRIAALGVQGRWALNEGFFWLPDFAITGGANRVLCLGLPSQPPLTERERTLGTTKTSCTNDLTMFTLTTGAVVSKTFSLLGMVTLTPFAGWQKVFLHASGPTVDTDESSNDTNLVGEKFRFRDYKMWGDFVGQDCGEADATAQDCITDHTGTPQLANLVLRRNKLYGGVRVHFSVLEATLQTELTHIRGTQWDLTGVTFDGSTGGLRGVTTPDLQLAATFRLGFLF